METKTSCSKWKGAACSLNRGAFSLTELIKNMTTRCDECGPSKAHETGKGFRVASRRKRKPSFLLYFYKQIPPSLFAQQPLTAKEKNETQSFLLPSLSRSLPIRKSNLSSPFFCFFSLNFCQTFLLYSLPKLKPEQPTSLTCEFLAIKKENKPLLLPFLICPRTNLKKNLLP